MISVRNPIVAFQNEMDAASPKQRVSLAVIIALMTSINPLVGLTYLGGFGAYLALR